MRRLAIPMVIAPVFIAGCAARPNKPWGRRGRWQSCGTCVRTCRRMKVEQGLDQACSQYRRFLKETPETAMTPEAMRASRDLQLEKQFGIRAVAPSRGKWPLRSPPGTRGLAAGSPNPAAGLPARVCWNPIRISKRRTTAEPESWRAITPAPRPRTL